MNRSTWLALAIAAAMAVSAVRLLQSADPAPAAPANVDTTTVDMPTTLPNIRVLLGVRDRAEARVRIEGPYWAAAEAGWQQILAQGEKLPEVSIQADADGIQIGGEHFPVQKLKLDAKQDGSLWVDGRRYHGSLVLYARPEGRFSAVNELPLEAYLASVISCEMPAGFPVEAQKAQLIAARTYALYQMKTLGRAAPFDVYDSTRSQAYRGIAYRADDGRLLAAETEHSRRLVAETSGVVVTYQDRLFCGYFSAVCGGHTANGPALFGQGAPPLVGVPCDGCRNAPKYRWKAAFPRETVRQRLAAYAARSGHELGELESITSEDPGGGMPPRITAQATEREITLSSVDFRREILPGDTPSPFFTCTLTEDELRLQGRGWGHGVGFCQWGSRGLAQRGLTAEQILAHYYPGSQLSTIR